MEATKQHWHLDFVGNPFSLFHYKMWRLKITLTHWSQETFGKIFQEISTLEDVIKVQEIKFKVVPYVPNRKKLHNAQAMLNNYLHRKKDFQKQNVGMEWFIDG